MLNPSVAHDRPTQNTKVQEYRAREAAARLNLKLVKYTDGYLLVDERTAEAGEDGTVFTAASLDHVFRILQGEKSWIEAHA